MERIGMNKEIERIIKNNTYLDIIFTRYQDGNCSKRYLRQEISQAIEQYVIKARIEVHNCYTDINCSFNNFAKRSVKTLKKGLK